MISWESIRRLQGRTLKTLKQSMLFDVVEVTASRAILHLHSTGNDRFVPRREIEGVVEALLKRRRISRKEIEANWSPRNPAYVAAMLAALPEIECLTSPIIKLCLKDADQPVPKEETPGIQESPPRSFRSSAAFGKRQEFIAIAELLRRGHDVYLTLVDDQQIDCVIRQERGKQIRYLDIQIKARSKDCAPGNAGRFAALKISDPRENYYFIFYSEQANTYWILPSLQLIEEANQNKSGKNEGKYSISFCNLTREGVTPRPRFRKYENAFYLLAW